MVEDHGYKIRTFICEYCGEAITGHFSPRRRFCSLSCKSSVPCPNRRKSVERPCNVCGKMFYKPTNRGSCSLECRDIWIARNKTRHTCKICGKEFRWSPSRTKSGQYNIKYCSLPCRDADPATYAHLIEMNAVQQRGKQTGPERIGYALLDGTGIHYLPQHVIGGKFCVDAFIPDPGIVIQFDGDYWHCNPDKYADPDKRQRHRMKQDKSQDAYMAACGYRVIRVWASQLDSDPGILEAKLSALLS